MTLRYTLLAVVLLIAFGVRLYRIDSPLWLDEIYSYRLASLGPQAIVQNSITDPHPPFYYLMQWVASGFGQAKTEIGWRWLPVLSGTLLVAMIWLIVKDIAGFAAGVVFGLAAATSPSLVFYSQEARPTAFLVLVASLSMWLTIAMLRDASKGRLWIAWTMLSILGLYTGYVYVMIVGVQLLFLGLYYHRQITWRVAGLLIIGSSILLVPFAANSLGRVASIHAGSKPLTFWRCLQTLSAGEPLRYGFSLSHAVFPVLATGLFLVSVIRAIRLRDKALGYYAFQVALPMGAFFVLSPVLGIRLPPPEAKQFMLLLPAILVLMAGGYAELCSRFARTPRSRALLATVACGVMVVLNTIGLQSYWSSAKSPEALAVLSLRDKLRPGESVVSLHYSTTYALGFYTEGIPTFLYPRPDADTYMYRLASSEDVFRLPLPRVNEKETEDIRALGQFWILAHSVLYREPLESLVAGCQIVEHESFAARNASFELIKVSCPVHPHMQSPAMDHPERLASLLTCDAQPSLPSLSSVHRVQVPLVPRSADG